MKAIDKRLSIIAAVLLLVAVFSMTTPSPLCLISSSCTLMLSLGLRHRGAFRDDNMPLAGAFLIGGSAMMVLIGLFLVSPMALLIVAIAVLIPMFGFLMVFGIRERMKSLIRRLDELLGDEKPPP